MWQVRNDAIALLCVHINIGDTDLDVDINRSQAACKVCGI